MVRIDTIQGHALRTVGQLNLHLRGLRRQILLIDLLAEEKQLSGSFLSEGGQADFPVYGLRAQIYAVRAGHGQHLHRVKYGLGNAIQGHHAKSAVELLRELVHFIKNIAEAPDGGTIHEAIGFQGVLHIVGGGSAGIIVIDGKGGAGVPLRIIDRQPPGLGFDHLGIMDEYVVAQLPHEGTSQCGTKHIQGLLVFGKRRQSVLESFDDGLNVQVFRGGGIGHAGQGIPRVLMGGYEIKGNVPFLTEIHKFGNPLAGAGGRTAHFQPGIQGFDFSGYTRKGEKDLEKDTFTQFSYACKQLGIEIETTSIPEAKGRVERLNQTLQSRLPIIFRREGITDIDAANEFLAAHIDELFNDKFAMPIDHTKDVFEKQIGGKEIDEAAVNLICSVLCSRVLSGQCIRYNKKMYKLVDEDGIQQNYADHTKVTVINTFDNQLYASVNDGHILKLEEIPEHAEKSRTFDADYEEPKPRKVYIPPMNHPWRYSEFEKHAKKQRHRIEMELQNEDMFLDHLQGSVEAGYLVNGRRIA